MVVQSPEKCQLFCSVPEFRPGANSIDAAVTCRKDLAEEAMVREIREAIRLFGNTTPSYFYFLDPRKFLVNYYCTNGRLAEAHQVAIEGVRLRPSDPEGHALLGAVLILLNRWDESVASLREAARLSPSSTRSNDLGFVLSRVDPAAAASVFREAIASGFHFENDPFGRSAGILAAVAHANLAEVLAALGQAKEAIAEFETALRLDPGFFDPPTSLSVSLFSSMDLLGDAQRSRRPAQRETYERLLSGHPTPVAGAQRGPTEKRPTPRQAKSPSLVTGSGFFITPTGYLVTNAHVVESAQRIELRTKTGTVAASLVRLDRVNDLALLKADGEYMALPLSTGPALSLGTAVFTVGFPNPGLQGLEAKLTKGDISSLAGAHDDPRHYQISVPVQPGNSGGPLMDLRGNVVGVVLARLSDQAALKSSGALAQNVNYAVKIDYLNALLQSVPQAASQLARPGTVERSVEEAAKRAEAASALVIVETNTRR